MTLSLTPQMQRFIDERVRTGRYASAEDVVRAGLASLSQQEAVEASAQPSRRRRSPVCARR